MVNVGKYTIHGSLGLKFSVRNVSSFGNRVTSVTVSQSVPCSPGLQAPAWVLHSGKANEGRQLDEKPKDTLCEQRFLGNLFIHI